MFALFAANLHFANWLYSCLLCAFACEFSINALSELNMYCVFLFANVSDFCWLQNKLTMLFCSCLLVDELMLSSSHRFISIFNVDFLISIVDVLSSDAELFFFYFFIKCMQSMTMTLSTCCVYAKLHVIWSKSLLYIFSLINHIDSLHIQALSLKLSQSYSRFSSSLRILRVLLFRF